MNIQEIIESATLQKATDIQFCSADNGVQVFFRMDDKLHAQDSYPQPAGQQACAAFFEANSTDKFDAAAFLDTNVSAHLPLPSGVIGIRLASAPVINGFVIVMRLLYEAGIGEHKAPPEYPICVEA